MRIIYNKDDLKILARKDVEDTFVISEWYEVIVSDYDYKDELTVTVQKKTTPIQKEAEPESSIDKKPLDLSEIPF